MKTQIISFKADADTLARLKERASKEDRPVSQVIRLAVKAYLDKF